MTEINTRNSTNKPMPRIRIYLCNKHCKVLITKYEKINKLDKVFVKQQKTEEEDKVIQLEMIRELLNRYQ